MIIKIIKKINLFVFTVIIFFMSSIRGMEQATTEINQQLPMMRLPKEIFNNIYFHISENINNKTNNFYKHVKFFLTLRSTCSHFNKLLTAEHIGQFCEPYEQNTKDEALKKVLIIDKYKILRFPSLMLIYAKANPNVFPTFLSSPLLDRVLYNNDLSFIKILLQHNVTLNEQKKWNLPPLFLAKTKEAAQLLIEHGADINIKNENKNTNILWYLIENNLSQKTRVNLFQFYIDKDIDSKALCPSDNTCLFHHLASYWYCYNNKSLLKLGKILCIKIPDMINIVDKYGATPLDMLLKTEENYNIIEQEQNNYYIQNSYYMHFSSFYLLKSYKEDYRKLKKFIALLQKNGAKTARQLKEEKNKKQEQQIIDENEPNHCLICLMNEKLIPIPCNNKHVGSNICQDCCNQLQNSTNKCPLCREKLKK